MQLITLLDDFLASWRRIIATLRFPSNLMVGGDLHVTTGTLRRSGPSLALWCSAHLGLQVTSERRP